MIIDAFKKAFGTTPFATNYTPGRVNLLGEHIDYNGGLVLPTALPIGIETALSPRTDNKVRIASDRFEGIVEFDLSSSQPGHWGNYVLGAVKYASRPGLLKAGADVMVLSTMPDGGGLSSSAALIVSIFKTARDISGVKISDSDIAVLARKVENDYIGVPCGIMDQMAVAIAKQGEALALNTKTLAYDLIDLPTNYHMAVIHSGVQRKLSEGRYAVRKEECDIAKKLLGRDDICLVGDAELQRIESFPDPISKRARHCVREHRRAVNAALALKASDIETFGRLMDESHLSMRDDFEMSVPQIDALVASAKEEGAIGARLTGGGFGGCIVACVEKEDLDQWATSLLARHLDAYFIC